MIDRLTRAAAGYSDEHRPLRAYLLLTGGFNALLGGFLLSRRGGNRLPERIATRDILLLGVATWRISRLVAKDKVTSPLRAPFTTFDGFGSGAEVNERPRGSGLRLAIGELIT